MEPRAIELPDRVDVAVIGGGIIGCAAAAIMADRGAHVLLAERTAIGAGASGRNLGALQHPFDPVLAPLYLESLSRYRALAEHDGRFGLPAVAAGLLLLHRDEASARAQAKRLARSVPELAAAAVSPAELAALEPSLAPGPAAVRLQTGHPIPPASATEAWAALAAERGVDLAIGMAARPDLVGDAVGGLLFEDGRRVAAAAVLVAAGPWTPDLVDPSGRWRPIRPTYGVTVQLRLGQAAPRHIIEEDAVDAINVGRPEAATARAAAAAPGDPPSLFSVASANGISTIGSTFLPVEPDPASIEPILLARAAAFLPAVEGAEVLGRRMCARPQSIDGRPLIGPVPGVAGLHACAGHGPWGISTGPASAAMAARAILDGTPPPDELAALRPI